MKYSLVKTLLLLLLLASMAFADQSIDHDSGLTVTHPDGWSALVDPANDENMLISSPDRRWLAAFSLVRGESAQGAASQVLEEMTKMVSHPKIRDQYWIAAYVEHAGKVYLIRGAGTSVSKWWRTLMPSCLIGLKQGLSGTAPPTPQLPERRQAPCIVWQRLARSTLKLQ